MTSEQLEQLAELIANKVADRLEKFFEDEEPKTKEFGPMNPEQFFHHQVDGFGNIKHSSRKDLLALQLTQLLAHKEELLKTENYELLTELQEIYDKLKKEYDNL
jgi:hypothetical protein